MFKIVIKQRFLGYICVVVMVIGASQALAEIHKWVDKNGKVHYGDRLPESGNVKLMEISVESFSSVEIRGLDAGDLSVLTKDVNDEIKNKKVVMYSTESCGYCKKAKAYFNAKGISYTERDINKDASARRQWEKLNGTGVPLILVGKSKMSGFNAERFERMYFN